MTRDNLGNSINGDTDMINPHRHNTNNKNEEIIPLKELEKEAIKKSIAKCVQGKRTIQTSFNLRSVIQ